MAYDPNARAVMRLSPPDNVAVALRALKAGESVALDGVLLAVTRSVAVGHKLAAQAINQGEVIVKYGCPIGIATRSIVPGEHVHTHNMQSNYTSPLIISK